MKNLFALLLCLCTAFSVVAQAPNANYDPDWDGDGNLGVSDLLGFLGLFGDFDTDGDGVWDSVDDCTDLSACNFDSDPTSYCLYYDAVGECGGNCAYVDAIGICNGWCESDDNEDGICDFNCGIDSITYHGHSYATVQIGQQCWLSENLRTELYANNDSIPTSLTNEQWHSTTSGAVVVYGYGTWPCSNLSADGDACDSAWSLNEYGRLYNWYAVEDERGLCPTGWHVPTDGEWMTLEMELGMSESDANSFGNRGTDQGTQMKTTYGWYNGNNGTNSSGFSGLPAGALLISPNEIMEFHSGGAEAAWWCSDINTYPADRSIQWNLGGVNRYYTDPRRGYSIRCLMD